MRLNYPDRHQFFCDIVSGKAESYRVDENNHFVAILDIAPMSKGHTLILPKRPLLELNELTEAEVTSLHSMIRNVSEKISKCFAIVGISIMQNGGLCNSISYLHIHVIPRYDTKSIWKDELQDLTDLKDIHAQLNGLEGHC